MNSFANAGGRTYLLVGHVTRDLLPDGDWVAGGTVTVAAALVRALGWRPIIVTAAGPGFAPPAHLADIEWRVLPSPATTAFRNEYARHGRRQSTGQIRAAITAR